jgi:HD-GYP domain-containing protein (c-di-GMP phosphodiesterase class II)
VAQNAVRVAERLQLPDTELSRLELAGLLHDIGKIGVREEVLHKPGSLTDDEYEHIKTHCRLGARILRPIEDFAPILDYVVHHHERADGRGYPDGLRGVELSVGAKILAICDAHDAMTSKRPYRSPFTHEHAREELLRCRGTQFDAVLTDVFVEVLETDRVAPAAAK